MIDSIDNKPIVTDDDLERRHRLVRDCEALAAAQEREFLELCERYPIYHQFNGTVLPRWIYPMDGKGIEAPRASEWEAKRRPMFLLIWRIHDVAYHAAKLKAGAPAEIEMGLRKLLEAQDCFLRGAIQR